MPRYIYRCVACELQFEISHAMTEKLADCEQCEVKGTLLRIPENFIILNRQQTPSNSPGSVVNAFIEDTKREVAEEKKRLKQRKSN